MAEPMTSARTARRLNRESDPVADHPSGDSVVSISGDAGSQADDGQTERMPLRVSSLRAGFLLAVSRSRGPHAAIAGTLHRRFRPLPSPSIAPIDELRLSQEAAARSQPARSLVAPAPRGHGARAR